LSAEKAAISSQPAFICIHQGRTARSRSPAGERAANSARSMATMEQDHGLDEAGAAGGAPG
jgi:hypothetical protein